MQLSSGVKLRYGATMGFERRGRLSDVLFRQVVLHALRYRGSAHSFWVFPPVLPLPLPRSAPPRRAHGGGGKPPPRVASQLFVRGGLAWGRGESYKEKGGGIT